jgi:glycerophosphoryl diester phosphodiesterase
MNPMASGAGALAIAHRGDPVRHRENTLPAIAAAVEQGAALVEIDVRLTADGTVVLLHDETLERLWGIPAPVDAVLGADLPAGIPTLVEALDLVAGSGTGLLIDMPEPAAAAPAHGVVTERVAAATLQPEEVAWCGAFDALAQVRAADPDARVLLSWDESDYPPEHVVEALAPEAFNPNWRFMSPDVVAWAHDRGMAACCWTVDDRSTMVDLLRLGVNAVITNRIGMLGRVLDELDDLDGAA